MIAARCISIGCPNNATITVEREGQDVQPTEDQINAALHAAGWREGFCSDHSGATPG